MFPRFFSFCWFPLLVLLVIAGSGCSGQREVTPTSAPGTISIQFRNRWWHYYERGLSWAEADRLDLAEADFRQCLALRQTDSRQARTYGMHFVQCFAHRELGSVLIRLQRNSEAKRELTLSLEQEPSAKAEYLLAQLERTALNSEPQRQPQPGLTATHIQLSSMSAVTATVVAIAGCLTTHSQTTLWSVDAAHGVSTPLLVDGEGRFLANVPIGSVLTLGSESAPGSKIPDQSPFELTVTSLTHNQPELVIDGPDNGVQVADGHPWYRYRVSSEHGLEHFQVTDEHGDLLTTIPVAGIQAAGMVRISVPTGDHQITFQVRDRVGTVTTLNRHIDSKPGPLQDRRLRAVAMAIPLQSPRSGGLKASDDPRLFSALMEDGRFRFIDHRADEMLTRELSLVEAGYVDRSTAAQAGRRLSCRYVIAGTLQRGPRDIECFLRLIHCESGRVVANADAYMETAASINNDEFFNAVASRLRQAFPIVSGAVVATNQTNSIRVLVGQTSGAVALMRLHVFADSGAAQSGGPPVGVVEAKDPEGSETPGVVISGRVPKQGWAVSE